MKHTFFRKNIPNDAKKAGESNEDAFLRITDTWMGEYEHTWGPFDYETLGIWITKYMRKFDANTFPVAWIDDENGNMVEYFVFYRRSGKKILKHEVVEL